MNKASIILSHSGKQHSYHVAAGLQKLGVLNTFYTSSYVRSRWLQKFIQKNDWQYLSRRFQPGLGGASVRSAWRYELKEIAARKMGAAAADVQKMVYQRDDRFDRNIARRLKRASFDCFWGFQGSSLHSIRQANARGKESVCELTIAHLPYAKKILAEEVKLHPDWEDSIDFAHFPADYEQRLIEEPLEARQVIAISAFLKQTLVSEGIPDSRITVLPLGFDVDRVRYRETTSSIDNRPLRLLYAGRVTQRKGMQYLLDAIKTFNKKDVELHVIGNIHGTGKAFWKQQEWFTYHPGMSQLALFNTYCDYDALIFPSVLEGFGLVSIEAMGAGLPVITTPHTNAYEILKDGQNGFLVPVRDTGALVRAISALRNTSDADYQQMRAAARATAIGFTWDAYTERLQEFLTHTGLA